MQKEPPFCVARHPFSFYAGEVEALLENWELTHAEGRLLQLTEACEAQAREERTCVSPGFYPSRPSCITCKMTAHPRSRCGSAVRRKTVRVWWFPQPLLTGCCGGGSTKPVPS
jgi:hypothetical protein